MAETIDPYHRWLGIAPKDQPPHHYRLLAVELFESDPVVIENAADQRMAHLRSVGAGKHAKLAQRLLNEIAAAKVCLLTPDKKAQYDQQLRARGVGRPASASAPLRRAEPLEAPKAPVAPQPSPVPVAATPSSVLTTRRKQGGSLGVLLAAGGGGLLLVVLVVVLVMMMNSGADSGANGTDDAPVAEVDDGETDGSPITPPPARRDVHPVQLRLTSNGTAAGSTSEVIEVAKIIPPTALSAAPAWRIDSGTLTADAGASAAPQLKVPVPLPTDYRLEFSATAPQQHAGLSLDLVVNGKPCRLVLDRPNEGQFVSGLELIDGAAAETNSTRVGGRVLPPGVSTPIACTVRDEQITVAVGAREILHWRGEASRLALPAAPPATHQVSAEGLPAELPFQLAALRITPLPPVSGTTTEELVVSEDGSIDLLAQLVPARDFVKGNTRLEGGRLFLDGDPCAVVALPGDAPEAYRLEIRALRRHAKKGTSVIAGVVVGDAQCRVVVDNNGGDSGLDTIDGAKVESEKNETTLRDTPHLVDNRPADIFVQVRPVAGSEEFEVRCAVDGETFLDTQISPRRVGLLDLYKTPSPKSLFVASWYTPLQFERIVLRPLQGDEAIAQPRTDVPKGTPEAPMPPQVARSEPPDEAAQAEVSAKIDEIYGARLQEANTPERQRALAGELLGTALESSDDAVRYVLLHRVQQLADRGEDPVTALKAIDALDARFEIDAWQQRLDTLKRMAETSKSKVRRAMAAGAAAELVSRAGEAERFEIADQLAEAAATAARRMRYFPLATYASSLRKEIQAAKETHDAMETARQTLTAAPEDTAAHGVLGRGLCLSAGDWEGGLSHLVQGDDAALASAAKRDLAAEGATPQQQVEAAEAWWELAQQRDESEQAALRSRARHWYETALNGDIAALTKKKVEDRLQQIAADGREREEQADVVLTPWLLRDALLIYNFEPATLAQRGKLMQVQDLSGRGHHGRIGGSKKIPVEPGPAGAALAFAGSNDLVTMEGLRNDLVAGRQELTIATWVNSRKKPEETGFVFSVGHLFDNMIYLTAAGGNYNVKFLRTRSPVHAAVPQEGGWHHVAFCWDRGKLRLYVDGRLAVRSEAAGAILDDSTLGIEEACLGTKAPTGYRFGNWFIGALDEFIVLPRALRDDEVAQLYRAGKKGIVLPSLIER